MNATVFNGDFVDLMLIDSMKVGAQVSSDVAVVEVLRNFKKLFDRNRLLIVGLHCNRLVVVDYHGLESLSVLRRL